MYVCVYIYNVYVTSNVCIYIHIWLLVDISSFQPHLACRWNRKVSMYEPCHKEAVWRKQISKREAGAQGPCCTVNSLSADDCCLAEIGIRYYTQIDTLISQVKYLLYYNMTMVFLIKTGSGSNYIIQVQDNAKYSA